MSHPYMNIKNPETPYRLKDLNVFFQDMRCLDIIQTVLDENGNIRNFPGIVKDERWEQKHRIGPCRDVRFEAQFFHLENGTYLMKWLIQPSGWEWVDEDGFGFSGDSSIMLYSILDETGTFLKKFELFSIDRTRYCHDFDRYLQT